MDGFSACLLGHCLEKHHRLFLWMDKELPCHRISKFLGCHHIVDREGRNKTKNQSISTMWKERGAWGLGETRGCRCLPCCFSWWDVKKRAPAVAAYGIQPPPHLYVSFTTVYSGRETKLLSAVQKNLIKIFHCVCKVQEGLLFSPSNTAADKVASYTILVLHLWMDVLIWLTEWLFKIGVRTT